MSEHLNGKHCPACAIDIGLIAIVKATLPNRIKCPHCSARLVYEPFPWGLVLVSSLAYLSLLIWCVLTFRSYYGSNEVLELAINILLAIVLWQPFEFFIARQLRNKHKLRALE